MLDSSAMARDLARLDEMNRLVDDDPGFVRRCLTDSRASAPRGLEDPLVLFTVSG